MHLIIIMSSICIKTGEEKVMQNSIIANPGTVGEQYIRVHAVGSENVTMHAVALNRTCVFGP